MIKFINFLSKGFRECIGLVIAETVYDITEFYGSSINNLIKDDLFDNPDFHKKLLEYVENQKPIHLSYSEMMNIPNKNEYSIQLPILPPEVWACGVTYKKTMLLHEEDISNSGGYKGLYSYVYDSVRPEIFFKALPQHCVGTNDFFSIRSDSEQTFIEAELACIYNKTGKIVGYTIANDITAWDIEKECPLFLNQAKIFKGSCVLGPAIVPASQIKDPLNLQVKCKIIREKKVIFEGFGNTSNLKRPLKELTDYLLLNNIISDGTVLCTGTAVGVPNDLYMKDGDFAIIEIENIGFIQNTAKKL